MDAEISESKQWEEGLMTKLSRCSFKLANELGNVQESEYSAAQVWRKVRADGGHTDPFPSTDKLPVSLYHLWILNYLLGPESAFSSLSIPKFDCVWVAIMDTCLAGCVTSSALRIPLNVHVYLTMWKCLCFAKRGKKKWIQILNHMSKIAFGNFDLMLWT